MQKVNGTRAARRSRLAPSGSGKRRESAAGECIPNAGHGPSGVFHGDAGESQGGCAGVHRDEALGMVGAVRRLETAITEGFATSYTGTALCGLADDTNKGYLHELRRYAARVRSHPGASARESLDDKLLHLAQTTNNGSSIKKLLGGIRLLEKLRWVPSTVCAGDWAFVKGVESFHDKAGKLPLKTWASMRGFTDISRLAQGAASWELCAMAALSICLLAACGQLRRSWSHTTESTSRSWEPRGGGAGSRRRRERGPRPGKSSCKCRARDMDTRPAGRPGTHQGRRCTRPPASWWEGRS